jgi:hypothetical protein
MAQPTKPRNPDDPPKRRNWAGAVSGDAGLVGTAAFVRAGFADPTLVLRWDAIAGPETARLARPVKLTEGPSGGVLTLRAEPGAALFLQHETRSLTDRINAYLGRPAVAKLRFVQGPLVARPAASPRPPAPKTVPPDDPVNRYQGPDGVREALLALARQRRRPRSD